MYIIADLHNHTNVSHHAFNSIDEMCKAAADMGHFAIAITNHGSCITDGAHKWHFGNMKILPKVIHGVRLLRGAELNILPDGAVDDIPEIYLKDLDVIIASFHETCFPPQNAEIHTKALYEMLKNPYVTILGHLGNPNYPFDMEYIISNCNKYNKCVELNAGSLHSRKGSEVNCLQIAKLCKKYNVPVFLNSDSHSIYTVGKVSAVAKIAEEAGIPKSMIINASLETLREYFLKLKNMDILERD